MTFRDKRIRPYPNASFLSYDIIQSHSHPLFDSYYLSMARTPAVKAEKPRIPEINWSANNSSAVWALLAEIEKHENYRVLYGKKDVAEVSKFLSSA